MSGALPPATAEPVHRQAARVLLLDGSDRLLLFGGADPHLPEQRFWFTPGGGVDPGETVEDAARRELQEETGCTGVPLSAPVWRRTAEFSFEGEHYRARETFLVARVPSWEVDTSGFTDLERRSVDEHRWWTLDELLATSETIYPGDLPALLRDLLTAGPPSTPVEIT
jgi:8-oxo-dGTP pyrophosphatase MutT (NUDIX family)